jgi:hypothetical protein
MSRGWDLQSQFVGGTSCPCELTRPSAPDGAQPVAPGCGAAAESKKMPN